MRQYLFALGMVAFALSPLPGSADGGGIELAPELLRNFYLDHTEDDEIRSIAIYYAGGSISAKLGGVPAAHEAEPASGGGLFSLFRKSKSESTTYPLGNAYTYKHQLIIAPDPAAGSGSDMGETLQGQLTSGIEFVERYADGHTIALTVPARFLRQEDTETNSERVQFLSDLPVVGQLFGQGYLERDQRGLRVLIRPEVVRNIE